MSVLRKVKTKANTQLPMLHPHAAGFDIGATQIQVAVPCDADPKPVRTFTTFTDDLLALRDWLRACGVRTVAKQNLFGRLLPAVESPPRHTQSHHSHGGQTGP